MQHIPSDQRSPSTLSSAQQGFLQDFDLTCSHQPSQLPKNECELILFTQKRGCKWMQDLSWPWTCQQLKVRTNIWVLATLCVRVRAIQFVNSRVHVAVMEVWLVLGAFRGSWETHSGLSNEVERGSVHPKSHFSNIMTLIGFGLFIRYSKKTHLQSYIAIF